MGRFLDEQPAKSYKGKFLDEEPAKTVTPEVKKSSPAYGGMRGMRSLALGGPIAYGTEPGSEDVLPMAGQTVGSLGGYGGSVAGATAGQAGRQAIRAVRGQGFDASAIPKEAINTATWEGLTRGASRIIPKVSNRLMLSILKPGREAIKRNPNLGIDALEAGITGTKSGMLSKAENLIDEGEDALSIALKSKSGSVDTKKIARGLGDIKRPFQNVGDSASVDAVKEVQKNLRGKGNIGLEEANQLKRDLYKVVKDTSYGKGVGEVASKTSARKQAARGLKEGIESVAPETKAINKKIGTGVQVSKALENALASGQQRVLLPKLASMGAGGLALSGNPIGAAGVMIGDRGVDLLRSAWMTSGTAKNLMRARKLGQPIAKLFSEGTRRLNG
jgi:hypothetical protein